MKLLGKPQKHEYYMVKRKTNQLAIVIMAFEGYAGDNSSEILFQ